MSIAAPALWIVLCLLVGFAGRRRALGFWGFFILSLVLSPVVMAVVLLLTQTIRPKKRSA